MAELERAQRVLHPGIFASGLPADALSYPLRIVGDASSALVEFEDKPAFFGHELRILGLVTFDSDRKIIRWIDYWDGRSALVQNSIAATYPTDFEDGVEHARPEVARVARALATAFAAGDVDGALALMSYDVVHEDMAAHTLRPRPASGRPCHVPPRGRPAPVPERAQGLPTSRAAAWAAATSGGPAPSPARCAAATPASNWTSPARSAV